MIESGARTVGDLIAELATACRQQQVPPHQWLHKLCEWPPDAFALASLILGESGGYRHCVSPPDPHPWPPRERRWWLEDLRKDARAWRHSAIDQGSREPERVTRLLSRLESHDLTPLSEIVNSDAWELTQTLLELLALADETCAGMGLFVPNFESLPDLEHQTLIGFANDLLTSRGTLCLTIPPDYLRVLPKRHTPQRGLSLRSVSLNLAMVRGEVATWWQVALNSKLKRAGRMNVLVAPWPATITPAAFTEVSRDKAERALDMDPQRFGFFDFEPPREDEPEKLRNLLERAKQRVEFIDAVLLPECALHEDQLEAVEKILDQEQVPLLLTGVRAGRRNSALLGVREQNGWTHSNQDKHHRWYLDRSQIEMYGIGGSLHPSKRWWENIRINPRTLHFVTPAEWLTLCHLICEDLARQDPVAHAVRAVGPTLVVGLLLDGPQHKDRWAARYATVLADDPGSSVLTVTSLGMALRSTPSGHSPSRVIALWKDAGSAAREITLAPGADGIVLSICALDGEEEYSADGRSTSRARTIATLAGVEQVGPS